MKAKVFTMKGGKLSFAGIREVRPGDAILDGFTSITETEASIISLRESAAPVDLVAAFRRMGLTDEQAEIAARGC